MRLREALDPSKNWSMTELLHVSCSYLSSSQSSDFVARRLLLGPPDEQLQQLGGSAESVLLQGNVDGPPPSEVARGHGRYECEMLKGRAVLQLQLQRAGGTSEEISLPVVKALFQRF